MRFFSALLGLASLAACKEGLAELWQPRVEVASVAAAPPIRAIAGRIGVMVSNSVPQQASPGRGERINIVESASLGDRLWLVRARLPLPATTASLVPDGQLEAALNGAPKAFLGLRLDADLRILGDQLGLGRAGRITSCDGDPVESALALRACLVLAQPRGLPSLGLEPLQAKPSEAGPVGNDAAQVSPSEPLASGDVGARR